jgi:DivIVA domain-containing protein
MDIPSLTFARTKFRLGYNQQEVDQFVDLIAANLALPLAERTLGPSQVTAVCFTSTTLRAGYDTDEVDHVLDNLGIRLGLPSPSEMQDASSPTAGPPLQATPQPVAPVVAASPTAIEPTDDFRPDPTF